MDFVHTFRKDRVNHSVLSKKKKVKRDSLHTVTICGLYVDHTFQRRVGEGHYAITTCPVCVVFMTNLMDILEAEDRPDYQPKDILR